MVLCLLGNRCILMLGKHNRRTWANRILLHGLKAMIAEGVIICGLPAASKAIHVHPSFLCLNCIVQHFQPFVKPVFPPLGKLSEKKQFYDS